MRHNSLLALLAGTVVLAACSSETTTPTEPVTADTTTDIAAADVESASDATPDDAPLAPDLTVLAEVIGGDWREPSSDRDEWRHPQETLEFLGIDPSGTIVEIWPGGGWYTDILAPWINANDGQYIAAHFDPEASSENRRRSRANFDQRVADTALYGDVRTISFNLRTELAVESGSVDAILTFRNIHNWMSYGFAERAFADFHTALAPGGILGVVEHRLPSTREQDPGAANGYVQQAYVIALAEEAGFEFVEASEVNANPADTADHPRGVWTLPPVRRNPAADSEMADEFDRAAYDAIGESDRMTLLFRKPGADE